MGRDIYELKSEIDHCIESGITSKAIGMLLDLEMAVPRKNPVLYRESVELLFNSCLSDFEFEPFVSFCEQMSVENNRKWAKEFFEEKTIGLKGGFVGYKDRMNSLVLDDGANLPQVEPGI